MEESLVALVAMWREVSVALALYPDSATLSADAQRVGAELLGECRRHGVGPVLSMLADAED